jgi:hypothetical protein
MDEKFIKSMKRIGAIGGTSTNEYYYFLKNKEYIRFYYSIETGSYYTNINYRNATKYSLKYSLTEIILLIEKEFSYNIRKYKIKKLIDE